MDTDVDPIRIGDNSCTEQCGIVSQNKINQIKEAIIKILEND